MMKRKFKKTEIGMIPEDWEVRTLDEIAEFTRGFSYKGSEKSVLSGEYIFITLNSVKEGGGFKKEFSYISSDRLKERHFINKGQIFIANTEQTKTGALLGSPALVEFPSNYTKERGVFSHHITKVTLKNCVDKFFVYYYLIFIQKNAVQYNTGSVIWALDVDNWSKNEKILLPPLPEQHAIAKILSDLDSKIELLQKQNETLEKIGQAIFKHWFVDFEFPNEEGKPYKSSGGEMVYNEELGKEIPRGWEVKPIDEVADFLNGLALQKYPPENDTEYLPVIKIRELKQGITNSTDKASINIPEDYVIDDGDIIFSWSGSLEVVIWGYGKGALNQHLFKVSSKKYPKWFYYYWIIQHLPEYRHIAKGKATTMGHIQRHHLKNSLVLVPFRMVKAYQK